jgi:hypothetical protein
VKLRIERKHAAEARAVGCVAVTRGGHNEPNRVAHSGRKTKQLIHKTDFPYHSGMTIDCVALLTPTCACRGRDELSFPAHHHTAT